MWCGHDLHAQCLTSISWNAPRTGSSSPFSIRPCNSGGCCWNPFIGPRPSYFLSSSSICGGATSPREFPLSCCRFCRFVIKYMMIERRDMHTAPRATPTPTPTLAPTVRPGFELVGIGDVDDVSDDEASFTNELDCAIEVDGDDDDDKDVEGAEDTEEDRVRVGADVDEDGDEDAKGANSPGARA